MGAFFNGIPGTVSESGGDILDSCVVGQSEK
jgi:hypothetical protein